MSETTSPEFFESMYQREADPWKFRLSDYEQSRYGAIISALANGSYNRAFEPGCSIGELTARLAHLCREVVAIDVSPTAVQHAQQHCRPLSNVDIRVGSIPKDLPDGTFDLIVFSEIGYYFEESELANLGAILASRLEQNGVLLAVHWLGRSSDHILGGERVHQVLAGLEGLRLEHQERHERFYLDKWVRL